MAFLALLVVLVAGVLLLRRGSQRAASARFNAAVEKERRLLMADDQVRLPVLDPHEFGYRAVGEENLVAVQCGISRFDQRGSRDRRDPVGRLLITDNALVFEGDTRNDRWTWAQIANVEILLDGYAVARRKGSPILFGARQQDPRTCAVMTLMLHHTK